MKYKYRIVVSAIIKKGNKILLGRKAPNIGPYPNTWHLPGGGVDLVNETCREAIKREINEETGIRIKNLKKIPWWDSGVEPNKNKENTHYIFLLYSCEYASKKLKAGDDINELKWFSPKDLRALPLPKTSKKLFTFLKLF